MKWTDTHEIAIALHELSHFGIAHAWHQGAMKSHSGVG